VERVSHTLARRQSLPLNPWKDDDVIYKLGAAGGRVVKGESHSIQWDWPAILISEDWRDG